MRKCKTPTSPPFIVLVDILFIVLLALMISQADPIQLRIPQDKLFEGAVLVAHTEGTRRLVDPVSGTLGPKYIPEGTGHFYYYLNCKNQCSHINRSYKNNLYIYFPQKLLYKISGLSFIAQTSEYECSSIEIDITEQGQIDYEKLIENNSCLQNIENITSLSNHGS